MPNWFLIALIAPIVHSLVVLIDKFLVINYSKGDHSSGGLVIFSSLVNIFVAIGILLLFIPSVFSISFTDKILLMMIGALTAVWFTLYLYAIEKEDGSVISAWFLSIPIFSYPLSYFILGESLKLNQILGSLIIIFGLIIISFNFTSEKFRIKSKRAIIYMTIACIIIAFSGIIFKHVTIGDGNFWISSFWEYLGLGFAGIFMLLFIPKYRKEFFYMNKKGGIKIFFLNILNESLTITGNLVTYFVMLSAPVTLVYMVGSFQPVVLLILAIILKTILPKFIDENLSKKELIIKFISIIIIIIGSIILFI